MTITEDELKISALAEWLGINVDDVDEYLTDCICDNMDIAVDFTGMRNDVEDAVSDIVHTMTDGERVVALHEFAGVDLE